MSLDPIADSHHHDDDPDLLREVLTTASVAVALLSEAGNPYQNLSLASRYLPSGSATVVGGNWYETVRLPFGRTLLAMGDVMGHGVEAAVDMSHHRSALRDIASVDRPPHRILRQLDNVISANDSARRPACWSSPIRAAAAGSSAGHLPPALVTPDRPTEPLRVPAGPPLGTGLGGYEQATHPLAPGQTMLLRARATARRWCPRPGSPRCRAAPVRPRSRRPAACRRG